MNNDGQHIQETIRKLVYPQSPTQWTGDIKPKRLTRTNEPPIWQGIIKMGQDADNPKYYTNLKCWLRPPTLRYPTAGLFVQLRNGNGTCYARISLADLQSIFSQTGNWLEEIKKLLPELEAKAQELKNKVDELDRWNKLQNLAGIINTQQEGEAPEDIQPLNPLGEYLDT